MRDRDRYAGKKGAGAGVGKTKRCGGALWGYFDGGKRKEDATGCFVMVGGPLFQRSRLENPL